MANGQQGKDPLGDIRDDAATAASRCAHAVTILDEVVATNGDPADAKAALDSVAALVKAALHGIQIYRV